MICRPGVLIPRSVPPAPPFTFDQRRAYNNNHRPEPEAYTTHLCNILPSLLPNNRPLRLLDLCTGTGCIALLAQYLLSPIYGNLSITALDVSPRAIRLARTNRAHNASLLPPATSPTHTMSLLQADMFSPTWIRGAFDVITCNPPYVSLAEHAHDTERSVRNWEPRLAQVPEARGVEYGECAPEDVFYARLLDVAAATSAKVVLCEVGGIGTAQAQRVVGMALRHGFGKGAQLEVWRDEPDGWEEDGNPEAWTIEGRTVVIRGTGNVRSIFIQRVVE
jgi:methylase of polypeptide subunit release factors